MPGIHYGYKKKGTGAHEPKAHTAWASIVHRRITPQQYVPGTHLYTWVKRDKVEKSSSSKKTTETAEAWTPDLQIQSSRC